MSATHDAHEVGLFNNSICVKRRKKNMFTTVMSKMLGEVAQAYLLEVKNR
jgi:hypothetical protein